MYQKIYGIGSISAFTNNQKFICTPNNSLAIDYYNCQ